jgi:hypothetical protein
LKEQLSGISSLMKKKIFRILAINRLMSTFQTNYFIGITY